LTSVLGQSGFKIVELKIRIPEQIIKNGHTHQLNLKHMIRGENPQESIIWKSKKCGTPKCKSTLV
jgi:hypothetical protein